MIIEEFIEDDSRVHHYSNKGFKIRQIESGIVYEDAIDVVPCRWTYEETDEKIESEETEEEIETI